MTLRLGPLVGHVGSKSANIWVRSAEPAVFQCRVCRDPELTDTVGQPTPLETAADRGCTGVAKVGGLPADTRLHYDVVASDGQSVVPSGRRPLTFRTAPAANRATGFSFAFASCNKPLVQRLAKRWKVWQKLDSTLAKPAYADLRLLILCGDQIYADTPYDKLRKKGHDDPQLVLRKYRDEYQKQWQGEEMQRVLGRLPTYMIWDDHEIANGWGSHKLDATATNRQNLFKGALQTYREFQHSHGPNGASKKLHYGFRVGRTGFLVLDLRGRRNMARKTDPLMGEPQWKDIRAWIETNKKSLSCLFVVSSVPVAHAPSFVSNLVPKSDLRDQWNYKKNLPELRRLLRDLFDLSNERDIPVVILGGDVHVGTFACIRSARQDHYRQPRIYQLTSSPISNSPSGLASKLLLALGKTHKIDDWLSARVIKLRTKRNFGIVHVEYPKPGKCAIRFELHEEGRDVTRLSLGSF